MIEILHYEDKEEWNALLDAVNVHDIFFSPEYLKLNELIIPGEAECFVFQNKEALVLYPYLKRPIEGSEFFDVTSPYGYGGYVDSATSSAIAQFNMAFYQYCRGAGIVSEFIRFHSLYNNHCHLCDSILETIDLHPVVIVDYTDPDFSLETTVTKEAYKKIRKAQKHQIHIVKDVTWRYYDEFIKMYHQTMALKHASAFYYFGQDFFTSLRELLNEHTLLFVALCDERVIGALLVLYTDRYVYNYLSCSDRRYLNWGTNDLLQFAVLEWAYQRGCSCAVLGGGMHGEDSLFHFKAKFSPRTRPFFIGKRVHLPQEYFCLCHQKVVKQQASLEEFFSRDWFPLYRSRPPKNGEGGSHGN